MAVLLKGINAANKITEDLIEEVKKLSAKGLKPCLAILRIGENPDDLAYERGIENRFHKIGLDIKKFILNSNSKQEDVLKTIDIINNDKNVHGCLIFRPLPKEMDDNIIRNALTAEKDLDGITDSSLAAIFTNSDIGFAPCTAEACIELLKHYNYELKGKNIVVVGRSLVIGKPVAMMLVNENATVTICHSKTKNMAEICKRADIVIAAVGKAQMIDKNYASKGQIFIDVGINVDNAGNLLGDIDFDNVEPLAEAISPVPRGVGSVTTSILARHLVEACKRNI